MITSFHLYLLRDLRSKQTSMNVLKAQQSATRGVSTLKATTHVTVPMDMTSSLLMTTLVSVRPRSVCQCTLQQHKICSHLLTDVDECSTGNGGCQHNCNNTVGSYHCYCRTGYTLDSDGRSCNGKCCSVS